MVILEINWDPKAVVCNCTFAAGKQSVFTDMQKMTQFTQADHRQKILFQRAHDDILKNPVDLYECENGKNHDRQYGPDDMPSQGFKMLNKRHFCLPRCSF